MKATIIAQHNTKSVEERYTCCVEYLFKFSAVVFIICLLTMIPWFLFGCISCHYVCLENETCTNISDFVKICDVCILVYIFLFATISVTLLKITYDWIIQQTWFHKYCCCLPEIEESKLELMLKSV